MKILKWALLAWSVCASVLVLLALLGSKSSGSVTTHVFCAYSRLFVEFDEGGKRWGTIMLDYDGRAIPCKEDDDIKIENTI